MPRLALVGGLSIAACEYAQTDDGGLALIAAHHAEGWARAGGARANSRFKSYQSYSWRSSRKWGESPVPAAAV